MGKNTKLRGIHQIKSRIFNKVKNVVWAERISSGGLTLPAIANAIARRKEQKLPDSKKKQWAMVLNYALERGIIKELPEYPDEPEIKSEPKRTPKNKFNAKYKTLKQFSAFYQSKEWRQLRFKALLKYGRKCMCCNVTDKVMHVDHVKPRSKYPELELELSNLQILCEDCNMGKGGWSEADFREPEVPEDVPADFEGFDAAFRDTVGKPN